MVNREKQGVERPPAMQPSPQGSPEGTALMAPGRESLLLLQLVTRIQALEAAVGSRPAEPFLHILGDVLDVLKRVRTVQAGNLDRETFILVLENIIGGTYGRQSVTQAEVSDAAQQYPGAQAPSLKGSIETELYSRNPAQEFGQGTEGSEATTQGTEEALTGATGEGSIIPEDMQGEIGGPPDEPVFFSPRR